MKTFAVPVIVAALQGQLVRAQQPAASLSFEVASVKQDKAPERSRIRFPQFQPGGRFTAHAPVYFVIAAAYGVSFQSIRLSGGPDWIRSEQGVYEIDAKAEAGSFPSELSPETRMAKARLMLQSLLADRFKLKMRRETKEIPVYALVAGKNGPKLEKAKIEEKDCVDSVEKFGTSCHSLTGGMGRGMHGEAVTMADVVSFAENWSDRPMVDKTGIQGLFNIQTEGWAPLRQLPPRDEAPAGGDAGLLDPTRLTLFAVFDRLGLKLESQKAPIETFVIEQIERPSEN